MALYTFTQARVGDYMKKHYICIKLQVDSTAKDDTIVQRWRADTRVLSKQYNVSAYPTMMFLNAQGEPYHRLIGIRGSKKFIAAGRRGEIKDSGYYALLQRYSSGDRSPSLLLSLAYAAGDDDPHKHLVDTVSHQYLATETNTFSPAYLHAAQEFIRQSSDPGFDVLLAEPSRVNAVLGQGMAQQISYDILLDCIAKGGSIKAQETTMEVKNHGNAIQFQQYRQLISARNAGDTAFFRLADSYIRQYPKDISFWALAENAECAVQMYKDPNLQQRALQWIEPIRKLKSDWRLTLSMAKVFYLLQRRKEALHYMDETIAASEGFLELMYRSMREWMLAGKELSKFQFIKGH